MRYSDKNQQKSPNPNNERCDKGKCGQKTWKNSRNLQRKHGIIRTQRAKNRSDFCWINPKTKEQYLS